MMPVGAKLSENVP